MKKALFIVAGAMLLLASCQIERRHHLGGFYVHKNGKVNTTAVGKHEQGVNVVNENAAAVTPVVNETQVTQPVSAPQVTLAPKGVTNRPVVATPAIEEKAVAAEVQTSVKATTVFEKAAQREAAKGGDVDPVVLIILAIFLPPLAVYLYEGSWTKRCTVNVILTLLCGLPGMIHALIVVLE